MISRKWVVFWILWPVLLVLDQWSKSEILDRFRLGESVSVIGGFFNLTYVQNTGAAFGFLAQASPEFRVPFFMAIPLVALGVIVFLFKKLPTQSSFMPAALTLVMTGAVGNLIDRLRYGYVVDFLDFHWNYKVHFWVFNIADSAITVGVAMMLIDMYLQPPESKDAH